MDKLLTFLGDLEAAKIRYTLEHNREDSIMVLLVVPGERWEVEFFADEHVEVEVFRSIGMKGEEELERLWRDFKD
jgi:hypothetical protein